MGYVMTVLGPMAPEELGRTLMHEHLICDLTSPEERARAEPEAAVTLENAFDVTYYPRAYAGNHRLADPARAMREVALFKQAGGGAIVEVTSGGIGPDPAGLAAISRETGVPIVMGGGFYTEGFVDAEILSAPCERLAEIMIAQVREGAWGAPIRSGIIGEIGCSWPLTPFERRSLAAAAAAQRATGAAVTVHPGRHPGAPHEIVDLLAAAGADLARVVICHMDRTYTDEGEVVALARRGCVVEFDFFGIETSKYWLGVADLPTDWMRLRCVRRLFDAGLSERVTLSHDICTRSRLQTLGGHGYSHLVRNVVELMAERGFHASEVDQLFIDTPRRLLTIAA